jgi:hypothetical protein
MYIRMVFILENSYDVEELGGASIVGGCSSESSLDSGEQSIRTELKYNSHHFLKLLIVLTASKTSRDPILKYAVVVRCVHIAQESANVLIGRARNNLTRCGVSFEYWRRIWAGRLQRSRGREEG